jgi:hypothetical protein
VTGAAIVRWEAGGRVVLALHGAFDGASAWALRIAMDESPAREFLVDLSHAVEACDFAAGILASWARQWARVKKVRFRPGAAEHERLLAGHGLELDHGADLATEPELRLPFAWPAAGSPVQA